MLKVLKATAIAASLFAAAPAIAGGSLPPTTPESPSVSVTIVSTRVTLVSTPTGGTTVVVEVPDGAGGTTEVEQTFSAGSSLTQVSNFLSANVPGFTSTGGTPSPSVMGILSSFFSS